MSDAAPALPKQSFHARLSAACAGELPKASIATRSGSRRLIVSSTAACGVPWRKGTTAASDAETLFRSDSSWVRTLTAQDVLTVTDPTQAVYPRCDGDQTP